MGRREVRRERASHCFSSAFVHLLYYVFSQIAQVGFQDCHVSDMDYPISSSAWSPGHVAFRGASSHSNFEKEICTRILLHTCELGVPGYYEILNEGLVAVSKFWCHGAKIPKTSPV